MKKVIYPLLFTLCLAIFLLVGIIIGERRAQFVNEYYAPESESFSQTEGGLSSSEASAKLTYLFDLLRDRYVDTLDLKNLVEDAIPVIVEELDPHSNYIPASDLEEVNEQLDGSLSGIGVQFNIQQDTVMVIQVIAGGPSEKAGVMAGDRIVTVDDSTFCGKGITNDKVVKNSYEEVRKDLSGEVLQADANFGYVIVNLTNCDVLDDINLSVHRLSDGKYLGVIKVVNAGEFNSICTMVSGEISNISVGDKVVVGSAAIQGK